MQCSAVQCSAVQCSAVQCSAVKCSAVQLCELLELSLSQDRPALLLRHPVECQPEFLCPAIFRLEELSGTVRGLWKLPELAITI